MDMNDFIRKIYDVVVLSIFTIVVMLVALAQVWNYLDAIDASYKWAWQMIAAFVVCGVLERFCYFILKVKK